MDKITIDDKGITGLSDQLKVLKESDAYLFGEDKIVGAGGHISEDEKETAKPANLETQLKEEQKKMAEGKGDILTVVSLKRQIGELPQNKK